MNNQKCHWKSCLVRVISRVPSLCCRFWQWALRRKASWRSTTYLCTPPSGVPTPRVWSTVYRSDPATLYTPSPSSQMPSQQVLLIYLYIMLRYVSLVKNCLWFVFIGELFYVFSLVYMMWHFYFDWRSIFIVLVRLFVIGRCTTLVIDWKPTMGEHLVTIINRRWIKAERFLFTCVIVSTL